MNRFTFLKMFAVFALIAVLGGSPSWAAAPRTAERFAPRPATLPAPLGWLLGLLPRGWAKEGASADPYGHKVSPTPAEPVDAHAGRPGRSGVPLVVQGR